MGRDRSTFARPGQRLTRRMLLGGATGAALAYVLPTSMALSGLAAADGGGAEPKPLPGGVRGLHFYPPGAGLAVSTINDFDGVVGVADLLGSGTATLADGSSEPLVFRVDNRFMVGDYVDVDGVLRSGAFAEL